MAYSDIAPIVSGTGITKTQVETYFTNLEAPAEAVEAPKVTKVNVQKIANKLYSGEAFSISKLAGGQGLNTSQVKTIIKEIKALESAYNASQEVTPE